MSQSKDCFWVIQAPYISKHISRNGGATIKASRKTAHGKVFFILGQKGHCLCMWAHTGHKSVVTIEHQTSIDPQVAWIARVWSPWLTCSAPAVQVTSSEGGIWCHTSYKPFSLTSYTAACTIQLQHKQQTSTQTTVFSHLSNIFMFL